MASVGTPASMRSLILGIRVNLGFCGTAASYFWCGGALWGDRMPQSGGSLGQKEFAPPLFLCSFYWCVLYLDGHPRASPRTIAAAKGDFSSLLTRSYSSARGNGDGLGAWWCCLRLPNPPALG